MQYRRFIELEMGVQDKQKWNCDTQFQKHIGYNSIIT